MQQRMCNNLRHHLEMAVAILLGLRIMYLMESCHQSILNQPRSYTINYLELHF